MRRALALLTVVLAVLAVAAASADASAPRHGLTFELRDAGFRIRAKSPLGSDRVRLILEHHAEVAYYWVHAVVREDSVQARFGRLGTLDFAFTPDAGEGSGRCGARGRQEGTFHGALVFRGEHDYADIDATWARGFMTTRGDCAKRSGRRSGGEAAVRRAPAKRGDGRRAASGLAESPAQWPTRLGAAAGPSPLAAPAPVAETGVVLFATSAPYLPSDVFAAYVDSGPRGIRSSFYALREEKREGMRIERGAHAYGGAADFDWDLGTGTASVTPPAPFAGRAAYRREGRKLPSWRGSLRVPVLGAPKPMRLAGGAFEAHLRPDA